MQIETKDLNSLEYCGLFEMPQTKLLNYLENSGENSISNRGISISSESKKQETRYCKCGCGREIIPKPFHKWKGIPNYISGHNEKYSVVKKFIEENKNKDYYCKCGCGQKIVIKPHHKWSGIPEYILGHHNYGRNRKSENPMYGKFKENNPLYGKTLSEEHKNNISKAKKGKTWEELYGIEKTIKLKENLRNKSIGENNHFYGKTLSEEHKNNISKAKKGKKYPKDKYPNLGWRKTRIKQILPIKDTKIELKIQQFLKLLGIEFFTHQYIKEIEHGYQCDILIPSMNLVIECDGIYWHKYPIGNEIDHIRTKELLEKGFKVLRLWENEINNMDLEQFKERLK